MRAPPGPRTQTTQRVPARIPRTWTLISLPHGRGASWAPISIPRGVEAKATRFVAGEGPGAGLPPASTSARMSAADPQAAAPAGDALGSDAPRDVVGERAGRGGRRVHVRRIREQQRLGNRLEKGERAAAVLAVLDVRLHGGVLVRGQLVEDEGPEALPPFAAALSPHSRAPRERCEAPASRSRRGS